MQTKNKGYFQKYSDILIDSKTSLNTAHFRLKMAINKLSSTFINHHLNYKDVTKEPNLISSQSMTTYRTLI